MNQARIQSTDIEMTHNDAIFNRARLLIEDCILTMGGSPLNIFGLPEPKRDGSYALCRQICNRNGI